ncbi:hypothetical protein ACFL2H_02820 [Planctomycetota bacterium]
MAKPLAPSSTNEVDGCLKQLIVSLQDGEPKENTAPDTAEDHVTRMLMAVREAEQATEGNPDDGVAEIPIVTEPIRPESVRLETSDTDANSREEPCPEETDCVAECRDDPDIVDVVDNQLSAIDALYEHDDGSDCDEPDTSISDTSDTPFLAAPTAMIDVELGSPTTYIPRSTGDAGTIAKLREVANLTTRDALSLFRSRQLVSNAYIAFACAIVLISIAQFSSLFGVDHPGFARFVSWASIFLGLVAVTFYSILMIRISRREIAHARSGGASSHSTVS